MKSIVTSLALLTLLGFAAVAQAQNQGSIQLINRATQAKTITDSNGNKKTVMVPVGRVVPGTVVTYTITYRNTGTQPVTGVVVRDPIPANMTYIAGSVEGEGTTISYSIDGGKTWADSLSALSVRLADGSTRSATATDLTALRWVVNAAVAPGDSGSVSFRAVLQ